MILQLFVRFGKTTIQFTFGIEITQSILTSLSKFTSSAESNLIPQFSTDIILGKYALIRLGQFSDQFTFSSDQ
jgi:hypothetical protein